jgi:predicted porin
MHKLLLSTAAVALGLAFAAPAAQAADGVKLGLGGYMKGYVTWQDQDEDNGIDAEARTFDIVRDTEIHFTGETTLDNGLTVGFHTEELADPGDGFDVQESYAYFSGAWGRVNFGAEDGAAYLLQVAAPSADSNIDGIRQYVNPVNYGIAPNGDGQNGVDDTFDFTTLAGSQGDYAQDVTGYYDKITYLTPVFSGFQAGLSYTPDVLDFGANLSRSLLGVTTDDVEDEFGSAWEIAARYEGQFDQFGLTLGGGYTTVDLEQDSAAPGALDDREAWNVGANVAVSAFNVGAIYKTDNNGVDSDGDTTTWVVGADYTTGPYKLGASYANQEDEMGVGAEDLDTDRWSGGVTYTYGPGMTFRGSVHFLNHEVDDAEFDSTSVLLGTQINF